MPVRVRLRVAAVICLGAAGALLPWWAPLPVWIPVTFPGGAGRGSVAPI